jgi:Peptidase M66
LPGTETAPTAPVPNSPALPALSVNAIELAQTHVLGPQGKSWAQATPFSLVQVANRSALVLVRTQEVLLEAPVLEARVGILTLGETTLHENSALPPTESNGARYSASARVATLPAAWMRPGLELRVKASNASPSAWQAVEVGADSRLDIRTIPFYLFGATEQLVSVDTATRPTANAMAELRAKWPIAQLSVGPHAMGKLSWPSLVVPPRNAGPAYVMNNRDAALDGFDPIAAVHSVVGLMRKANGESETANQYYGALVMAKADGSFGAVGGGLGGGHVGAGDHSYTGIFIHEQGHAFGLPHAGESYTAGTGYPYVGGSLSGSNWGFDQERNLFMPTTMPSSSSRIANCATANFGGTARQLDATGACIRQDPMQSGSGDQAAGDIYTLFADYQAARIQRYFEGLTTRTNGITSYSGGRIIASNNSPTGYQRWDGVAKTWVSYDPVAADLQKSLYGVHLGFPAQTNTSVYTLVFTRSHAETLGATQIYPAIGPYNGNLLASFDPTVNADLNKINPSLSGANSWYCQSSGCDYTLRLTYADATVRHMVVKDGFRSWFAPTGAFDAATTDPNQSASFKAWAINVPAGNGLTKVELLYTPQVWTGSVASGTVVASRNLP